MAIAEEPQAEAIEQGSNSVSMTLGPSIGASALEEINAGRGKGICEDASPERTFYISRREGNKPSSLLSL